jgi:hypothetical protein
VTILLGNGDGTFQIGQTIPTGSASEYVVGGDFAGNGIIDLAVANRGSNTISVLMGNGDGTFQPPVYYAVGNTTHSNPSNVFPGDFNGDGTIDLVTANFGEGTVSVLLGNHDGTFQPAKTYAVGIDPHGDGDVNPHFVNYGYFTGNGIYDLAVANMCDGDLGTVSVLLGNGDGTFQPALNFDLGLGMGPLYVDAGHDLNGDGLDDLIVTNQLAGKFSVLINDGNWGGGGSGGAGPAGAREALSQLPQAVSVFGGIGVFGSTLFVSSLPTLSSHSVPPIRLMGTPTAETVTPSLDVVAADRFFAVARGEERRLALFPLQGVARYALPSRLWPPDLTDRLLLEWPFRTFLWEES